jgi:hypothetical protein
MDRRDLVRLGIGVAVGAGAIVVTLVALAFWNVYSPMPNPPPQVVGVIEAE